MWRVDLRRGRIYLPAEDLDGSASARTICERGRRHTTGRRRCCGSSAIARTATIAAPLTAAADDARSLVAAEIMGGIYFEILQRIERNGYDVFSSRIRVPRPQRARHRARIWLRRCSALDAERPALTQRQH